MVSREAISGPLWKTRFCWTVEDGHLASACTYAHSRRELRTPEENLTERHPWYKTSMCNNFHTRGVCSFGTRCRYAHSFPELREFVPGSSSASNNGSNLEAVSNIFPMMCPDADLDLFFSARNTSYMSFNIIQRSNTIFVAVCSVLQRSMDRFEVGWTWVNLDRTGHVSFNMSWEQPMMLQGLLGLVVQFRPESLQIKVKIKYGFTMLIVAISGVMIDDGSPVSQALREMAQLDPNLLFDEHMTLASRVLRREELKMFRISPGVELMAYVKHQITKYYMLKYFNHE